jgi:ATP-binding cassette subfamily F protein 3
MLTIDGVTVRLGGRAILERASATVPVGARVGLIGRNGAGKSTLMKALIGEIEPDEGEISKPSRARIGYIAQEAPTGAMTPEEVVLASDTERAALLTELGVTRYAQIAGWSDSDIAAIDAKLGNFKGRPVRDQWIDQAKYLAAGDIAGFEAKYGKI